MENLRVGPVAVQSELWFGRDKSFVKMDLGNILFLRQQLCLENIHPVVKNFLLRKRRLFCDAHLFSPS